MRVCLVTPFAWSQPHDVNEHVAGVAAGLRALGHEVTVLAPSTRAADLLAGRRALLKGEQADVIAVGPAIPVSRRSQLGVPVGVQANLRQALAQGSFDLVHGFEPGLPSLSYLALRDTDALGVATFVSANRLGYPPARSQREKLLGRLDALIALSEPTREAAEERFPGDYRRPLPRRRRRPLLARDEAEAHRRRTAAERARACARGAARSARAARLGSRASPHTGPDRTSGDPARSRTACPSAHREGRRVARRAG